MIFRRKSAKKSNLSVEIQRIPSKFDETYDGIVNMKIKLKHNSMLFGNKIRKLRDEQGVLQRQLAALLEIDTPMFSKIERGDRRAKREQVIKLAEYLHQDEKEMLTLWLADKILDAVSDEKELSHDAITVAQEQIQK